MNPGYALEITVQTLDAALAAERGGATRIELCQELSVGGLTPTQHLMRLVRDRVKVPVFSMVRPREGDFAYSDLEFGAMKRDSARALQLRMSGVVFGVLTYDGKIDVARTRELVEFARPLPVTFHRAFDAALVAHGAVDPADPAKFDSARLSEALEAVIETGANRILTSGGAPSAPEGAAVLAELVRLADGRITILPGGGINAANLPAVAKATRAWEFHSGLSSTMPYELQGNSSFEQGVRELAAALAAVP